MCSTTPANYWDAASVIVNQLLEENDGSLEGKSIALLYHNSAYGREPIRTLETLSAMHGFDWPRSRWTAPRTGAGATSGCRSAASVPISS